MNAAAHDAYALNVTVLGLGEAGSIFAAGFAAGGTDVRGFDPADGAVPPGVARRASPAEAVPDMSATTSAAAPGQNVR